MSTERSQGRESQRNRKLLRAAVQCHSLKYTNEKEVKTQEKLDSKTVLRRIAVKLVVQSHLAIKL